MMKRAINFKLLMTFSFEIYPEFYTRSSCYEKLPPESSPFNRPDLLIGGSRLWKVCCQSEEQMIDLLRDADGAQVGVNPLTSRGNGSCPRLKVVSRMGVGVDSIDLSAATELGILVCNVPGVNTAGVAEHATAMLFTARGRKNRGFPFTATRDGGWRDDEEANREYNTLCPAVAGHTVGVVVSATLVVHLRCI